MSEEEIAVEVEQLWFAQELREDLADALEFSREKIRVVCVASCRSRGVIELVSEAKGVAHDVLLTRARVLKELVMKRESVFVGGVPTALYEYLQVFVFSI
mmetsp:Transcript_104974/g.169085  ORF Transcript_104974/g.169085 Transcript_104974/m.169085 type:complete len:100 (+) Transcript_104974:2-301(+)